MKIKNFHSFAVSLEEAKEIQLALAKKLTQTPLQRAVRIVAGADVAYFSDKIHCVGAVTLMEFPELKIIEQVHAVSKVQFPYIPGFLTFREAPVLVEAFKKITHSPDLVIFDGQGIAHSRKMGIAAHMGVILDMPTIGCAKSRLIGDFETIDLKKGNFSPLLYHGQQIGAVVCTRDNIKPVFVSPGHKITIDESVDWVLKCCAKYRIPEPVRQSHLAVNRLKSELMFPGA